MAVRMSTRTSWALTFPSGRLRCLFIAVHISFARTVTVQERAHTKV